ncbi:mucin-17-like [Bactrocera oleae]|uniref:mucin-17-like n=1 Tax=Bactrocera oleae TaxID=104688 RepID=UPI00387E244F
MVWCGLCAGGLIGPYSFENDTGENVNVNGDRYRDMITDYWMPDIEARDLGEMWCPTHQKWTLHQLLIKGTSSSQLSIITQVQGLCTTTPQFPPPWFYSSPTNTYSAKILVRDASGSYRLGTALLDSCSQVNFITDDFSQKLLLPKSKQNIQIQNIGSSSTNIKFKTSTNIKSQVTGFELPLTFCITSHIAYQPDPEINISTWSIPHNIALPDDEFYIPKKIDMLLGTETFFSLLSVGQINLGSNLPILQKTLLGWIVSGRYKTGSNNISNPSCLFLANESLDAKLEKLWKLEEITTIPEAWTREQQSCDHIYNSTVSRRPCGRIVVKLPFKDDPTCLGESYTTALKRFNAQERRLAKSPQLKAHYVEFMSDYESLGHMSVVKNPNLSEPHYYIPHHCIHISSDELTKTGVKDKINIQNEQKILQSIIKFEKGIGLIQYRALPNNLAQNEDITAVYKNKKDFEQINDVKQALATAPKSENECEPIDGMPDTIKCITYGKSFKNLVYKENIKHVYENKIYSEPTDDVKEVFTSKMKADKEYAPIRSVSEICQPTSHGKSRNNLVQMEDVTPLYERKNYSEPIIDVKETFPSEVKAMNECKTIDGLSDFSKVITHEKSLNNLAHTNVIITEYENQNHSEPTNDIKETVTSATKKKNEGEVLKGITDILKPLRKGESGFNLVYTEDVTPVLKKSDISESTDDVTKAFINKREPIDSISDISQPISKKESRNSFVDKENESSVQENKKYSDPLYDIKENFTSAIKHRSESKPIDSISAISQPISHGKFRKSLVHKEDVTTVYENKNHFELIDDVKKTFVSQIKNDKEDALIDNISDISKFLTHGEAHNNLVHKEDVTPVHYNKHSSEQIYYVKNAETSEVQNETPKNLAQNKAIDENYKNIKVFELVVDVKQLFTDATENVNACEPIKRIFNISQTIPQRESPNMLANKQDLTTPYETKNHSEPINNAKGMLKSAMKNGNKCKPIESISDISHPISQKESRNIFANKEDVTTVYKTKHRSEPYDGAKEAFTSATTHGNDTIYDISQPISQREFCNILANKEDISTVYETKNHSETIDDAKENFTFAMNNGNECDPIESIYDISQPISQKELSNILANKEEVTTIYEIKNHSEPIGDAKEAFTSAMNYGNECKTIESLSDISQPIAQRELSNILANKEDVTTVYVNKHHSKPIDDAKEALTSAMKSGNECEPTESLSDISQLIPQRKSCNILANKEDVTTAYETKHRSETVDGAKESFTFNMKNGNECEPIESISDISQPISHGELSNILANKEDVTTVYEIKHRSEPINDAKEAFLSAMKNENEYEPIKSLSDISQPISHRELSNILANKEDVTTVYVTKNHYKPIDDAKETFTSAMKNGNECEPIESISDISQPISHRELSNILANKEDVTTVYVTKHHSKPIDDAKEAFTSAMKSGNECEPIESLYDISQLIPQRESCNILANKEDVTTAYETKHRSKPVDDAKESFTSTMKNGNECEPIESISDISQPISQGELIKILAYKEDGNAVYVTKNHYKPIDDAKETFTSAMKNGNECEPIESISDISQPIAQRELSNILANKEDVTTVYVTKNHYKPIDDAKETFTSAMKNGNECEPIESISDISQPISQGELIKILAYKEDVTTVYETKIRSEPIDDAKEAFTSAMKSGNEFEPIKSTSDISQPISQSESLNILANKEDVTTVYEIKHRSETINDAKEAFTSAIKNGNECEPIESISDISQPISHGELSNILANKEDVTTVYEIKHRSEPINDAKEAFLSAMKNENEYEPIKSLSDISQPISHRELSNILANKEEVTTIYETKNHSEPIYDAKEAFTSAIKNGNECEPNESISDISQPISHRELSNILANKEDVTTVYVTKHHSKPIDDAKEAFTSAMKSGNECEPIESLYDILQLIPQRESCNILANKEDVTTAYETKHRSEPVDDAKESFTSTMKNGNECEPIERISDISQLIPQRESCNILANKEDVTTVYEIKHRSEPINDAKEAFLSAMKNENEYEPIKSLSDISQSISHRELSNILANKEEVTTIYEIKHRSEPINNAKQAFLSAMKNENEYEPIESISDISQPIAQRELSNILANKEDVTTVYVTKHHSKPIDDAKEAFTSAMKSRNECEPIESLYDISQLIPQRESCNILANREDGNAVYVTKNHYKPIDDAKETFTSAMKNGNECEPIESISDVSQPIAQRELSNILANKEDVTTVYVTKNHYKPIDDAKETFTSAMKNGNGCEPIESISDISQPIAQRELRNILANMEDVTTVYVTKHRSEPIDDAKEAFTSAMKSRNECELIESLSNISQLIPQRESCNILANKEDVTTVYQTKHHSEPVDDTKEAFTSTMKNGNECTTIESLSDISQPISQGELIKILAYKEDVTTEYETKNRSEPIDDAKEAFTSAMKSGNEIEPIKSMSDISQPISQSESLNILANKEDVTTVYEIKHRSEPINDAKEAFLSAMKNENEYEPIKSLSDISQSISHRELSNILANKEEVTTIYEIKHRSEPINDAKEAFLSVMKNENEYEPIESISDISQPIAQRELSNILANKEDVTIAYVTKHHSKSIDDAKEAFTSAMKSGNECEPIESLYDISQLIPQRESCNILANKEDVTIAYVTKHHSKPIDDAKEAFTYATKSGNECEPIESLYDISQLIPQRESCNILANKEDGNTVYVTRNHYKPIDDAKETFTSAMKNGNECEPIESISDISQPIAQRELSNILANKEDVTTVYVTKHHSKSIDDAKEAFTSAMKSGNECEPIESLYDISQLIPQRESCNILANKEDVTTAYETKHRSEPVDDAKESFTSTMKNGNECEPFERISDILQLIPQRESCTILANKEDGNAVYVTKNHYKPIDDAKETFTSAMKNGNECEPIESISDISQPIAQRELSNILANKEDVTTVYVTKNHYKPIDDAKETFTSAMKNGNECEPIESISDISQPIAQRELRNILANKEDVTTVYVTKHRSEPIEDAKEAFTSAMKSRNECELIESLSNISQLIPQRESCNILANKEDVTTVYQTKHHSEPVDDTKEAFTSTMKNGNECEPIESLSDISQPISQGELIKMLAYKEDVTTVYETKNRSEPIDDAKEAFTSAMKSGNEFEPIKSISDISQPISHRELSNILANKEDVRTVYETKHHSEPVGDAKEIFTSTMKNGNECEPIESISDISQPISHRELSNILANKEDVTTIYETKHRSESINDAKEAFMSAMKNGNECKTIVSLSDISQPISQRESHNILRNKKDVTLYETKNHIEPIADAKETFTSAMKNGNECEPIVSLSDISQPISQGELIKILANKEKVTTVYEIKHRSEPINDAKEVFSSAMKSGNECEPNESISDILQPISQKELSNILANKEDVNTVYVTKYHSEPVDDAKEIFTSAMKNGNVCDPANSINYISQPISQKESHNNLANKEDGTTVCESTSNCEPNDDVKEGFAFTLKSEIEGELFDDTFHETCERKSVGLEAVATSHEQVSKFILS